MSFWDFWIYVFILVVTAAVLAIAAMLMLRALQRANKPAAIEKANDVKSSTNPIFIRLQSILDPVMRPLRTIIKSPMNKSDSGPKASSRTKKVNNSPPHIHTIKVAAPQPAEQTTAEVIAKDNNHVSQEKSAKIELKAETAPKADSSPQQFNAVGGKGLKTGPGEKTTVDTGKTPGVAPDKPQPARISENKDSPSSTSPKVVASEHKENHATSGGTSTDTNLHAKIQDKPEQPVAEAPNSTPILELPKLEMSEIVPEEKQAQKPSSDLLNLFEVADEEASQTSDLASTLLDIQIDKLGNLTSQLVSGFKNVPAVPDAVGISTDDSHLNVPEELIDEMNQEEVVPEL
jgi:hypothetical protein